MFNKKEYDKQYRIDNKKKIRKYRESNSEKIKEYQKQYYLDNKEIILERSRRRHTEHREELIKYKKEYHIKNKEKEKKQSKQWRESNPEYYSQWKKQWIKKNPEYYNDYYKNKLRINLKFNLNHKMSSAIGQSLKGNKNGRHWETLVGYTVNDLMKRLKKTMSKGYDWQDFLEGKLHIDHKIPISAWNFDKSEHVNFQRCWALKNLQLLPAKENRIKHDRLTRPFQLALKI